MNTQATTKKSLTAMTQKAIAKNFASYWHGQGYEKGQTQAFWLSLLRDLFGIEEPEKFILFEDKVSVGHTCFIDARIPSTHVLIEQKELSKDLRKKERQSDGTMLTPFEQAKRYNNELKYSDRARYIVTCNFSTFLIYDMEQPHEEPVEIRLEDLPQEYYRLQFLVETEEAHLQKEMALSLQAGELVGRLYDALLNQYKDPTNEHVQKSLNMLCVRLVFCLYAEDAGIFGRHNMFHDYLQNFTAANLRLGLKELFRVLDTKLEDRVDLEDQLGEFPYVNGGLFSDETILIPPFTEEIVTLLQEKASIDFDWSGISPTIFGAVFESTLNPTTRRGGGMHYTSIENIHKVIDPLFLDELKAELQTIKAVKVKRTRERKLRTFQEKLASLTFFDPACGSGNFLTETYLSLRRLENEVLDELTHGMMVMGELDNPIKVSIHQFYGIEINDFAVTVAKTALWISEAQMMEETEEIVNMDLDFLPLKNYANIIEGNALRLDWNAVLPAMQCTYLLGNPPFISQGGASDKGQRKGVGKNNTQKEDMEAIFRGVAGAGNLDYVACWYKKACDYMRGNAYIQGAFVSTNSICQGQQVQPLWETLFTAGLVINFAHQSFLWKNETTNQAFVYCVIIGFSLVNRPQKTLYIYDEAYKNITEVRTVSHINGYLLPMDDIFIQKRSKPLGSVPEMAQGFKPADNGCLLLSATEKEELLRKEPDAAPWIRPFSMGEDFIKGTKRYCLWLEHCSPATLLHLPLVYKRVQACRTWREQQSKTGDAYKLKDTPHLLRPCKKFKDTTYIGIPVVTSGRRRYVPFGFVENGMIPGNKLYFINTDSKYIFGIMMSNVQNAWMRVIASRYGPSYNYANTLVYNNFPWPTPTAAQKEAIETTAQGILDARALYPDSNLAALYDPTAMPQELRKAHQANDKAVITAYGWNWRTMSEADCVAKLMELYQKLTKA